MYQNALLPFNTHAQIINPDPNMFAALTTAASRACLKMELAHVETLKQRLYSSDNVHVNV